MRTAKRERRTPHDAPRRDRFRLLFLPPARRYGRRVSPRIIIRMAFKYEYSPTAECRLYSARYIDQGNWLGGPDGDMMILVAPLKDEG